MPKIEWDVDEERTYDTGVDRGVLYTPEAGEYTKGVPWNGLTTVTESPSGAEASPVYADNKKYLNLISVEEFGGTIEAITVPREFYQFDGGAVIKGGIVVGQQGRAKFGFSYRTLIGDAVVGDQAGYKVHLVYGAQAAPSERTNTTINDSPEAQALSWEFTTTPVPVPDHKPSAHIFVDSTAVVAAELAAFEAVLYGGASAEPEMPLPVDLVALFPTSGTIV